VVVEPVKRVVLAVRAALGAFGRDQQAEDLADELEVDRLFLVLGVLEREMRRNVEGLDVLVRRNQRDIADDVAVGRGLDLTIGEYFAFERAVVEDPRDQQFAVELIAQRRIDIGIASPSIGDCGLDFGVTFADVFFFFPPEHRLP